MAIIYDVYCVSRHPWNVRIKGGVVLISKKKMQFFGIKTSVTSPGRRPVRWLYGSCPDDMAPPFIRTDKIQINKGYYI